jgi:NTP pyrophosphatase (non-canonical NTP hydrolase)
MKLTNEFQPIREWATQRGLYDKGDPKTQALKLVEEMGELAQSILKDDQPELEDAIGDCVVVLTNLAALKGITIEECINSSYNVISSSTFVKDSK